LQGRRLYEFKSGEAPASRWTGPTAAASVIFQVVSGNKTKIINWIEKGTPAGDLGLDFKGTPGAKLGEGYKKGQALIEDLYDAFILLRKDDAGGWYVLTGYPCE